jgi:uncharacterized membrane protein
MKLDRLFCLLPLVTAISANAHPGHGLGEHGAAHVITSPYHVGTLAVAGVALWITGRFVQRQSVRRVLQGSGLAMVLVAAAVFGSRF